MKRYGRELIILLVQLFMFYVFPLFAGPTDPMGIVVVIIGATLVLSFTLGILSKEYLKCFYPIAVSILFIPSVFIYYNASALIHAIWYLVVSAAGLGIGAIIRAAICKYGRNSKEHDAS